MTGVCRRAMSTAKGPGFFELRQYDIKPDQIKFYLSETTKHAADRANAFNSPGSRFLGFWSTEIGGNLNRVHHLYHYSDYNTRDKVRAAAAANEGWNAYLAKVKPAMVSQQSSAFIEASTVLSSCSLPGALEWKPPAESPLKVAYEMRVYQLQLGYNRVPDFLKLYGGGLPDKLRADKTGASELVTLLFSDSGPMNKVIEIWRHESMQRSLDSRVASREAAKWKEAIAGIAQEAMSFETWTLRPCIGDWK